MLVALRRVCQGETIVALGIRKHFLGGNKGREHLQICADTQHIPLRENAIDCVLSLIALILAGIF
jgi:hypothetical protein